MAQGGLTSFTSQEEQNRGIKTHVMLLQNYHMQRLVHFYGNQKYNNTDVVKP